MKIIDENFFKITPWPKFNAIVVSMIIYIDNKYWVTDTALIGDDYIIEISRDGPFRRHSEAKEALNELSKAWHSAFFDVEINRNVKPRRAKEAMSDIEIQFMDRDRQETAALILAEEKKRKKKERAHQYYLIRKQRLANGEDTNPNNRGPKSRIIDF